MLRDRAERGDELRDDRGLNHARGAREEREHLEKKDAPGQRDGARTTPPPDERATERATRPNGEDIRRMNETEKTADDRNTPTVAVAAVASSGRSITAP